MYVQYVGFADVREITASDLKKLGVEGGKKQSFAKGEPVEVSDEVGQALLEKSAFEGEFQEVADPEEARAQAAEERDRLTEQDLVGTGDSGTSNESAGSTTISKTDAKSASTGSST